MKSSILMVLCTLALMASCKSKKQFVTNENNNSTQLVGTWKGEEKDEQIKGVTKSWEMTRKKDGTFKVEYTINEDGHVTKHSETGVWKTEGNLFYDTNDYSGGTDVYSYQLIDNDTVRFKAHNMSMPLENANYEFYDIRITK